MKQVTIPSSVETANGHKLHSIFESFWKGHFVSSEAAIAGGQPGEEGSLPALHKLASLSCSKGTLGCSGMPMFKHKYKNPSQNKPYKIFLNDPSECGQLSTDHSRISHR